MQREEFELLVNLEVDLIPQGMHNRPETIIDPKYVTIHNTSNTDAGADARAHARYLSKTGYYMYKGKKIWTSWHYTVDDKRVVNHLPLDEEGYHAHQEANTSSIGIEICMNAGIDRAAADLRAARVTAALLYDLGLSADAIKTHQDWTGKKCPELLLAAGKWKAFKDTVISEFNTIDPPQGDAVPALMLRKPEEQDAPLEDVDHEPIPKEFLSAPNA